MSVNGRRHLISIELAVVLLLFIIMSIASKKILVLGGTGFVGKTFVNKAVQLGHEVFSVSRRGVPAADVSNSVKWLKADATDGESLNNVFQEHGPFDSCVHAIGVLFDSQSGLGSYNKYASGSGSTPNADGTYDKVTRQTAFNAIDGFINQPSSAAIPSESNAKKPFIFVSAAEAGWTFQAPVNFLERYLVAKRAVEKKLDESKEQIRPVIFRPALIWSYQKPAALVSVIPFFVANKIGIPFVDKPIMVDTLVDAMLMALQDDTQSGVKRYMHMEELAAKKSSIKSEL